MTISISISISFVVARVPHAARSNPIHPSIDRSIDPINHGDLFQSLDLMVDAVTIIDDGGAIDLCVVGRGAELRRAEELQQLPR